MLQPKRSRKAAVRNEPVETKIYSNNAEQIHSCSEKDHTCPAEEPRNKRQQSKQMTENKSDKGISLQLHEVLPRPL
jgi:hypothetical protein